MKMTVETANDLGHAAISAVFPPLITAHPALFTPSFPFFPTPHLRALRADPMALQRAFRSGLAVKPDGGSEP
jgi:hypothetical protein